MTTDGISCKVCDRGMLEAKRIHRMSGPTVVIGYVLLIPSLIGVALCVLAFCVLTFYRATPTDARGSLRKSVTLEMKSHGVSEEIAEQVVNDPEFNYARFSDDDISHSQMRWVRDAQKRWIVGNLKMLPASALDNAKVVGRREMEDDDIPSAIAEQVLNNPAFDTESVFDQVSMVQLRGMQDAQAKIRQAAYTVQNTDDASPASPIGRLLGQGFILCACIASFVGGLLGWLLVMKRSVLQCSLCRAVVDAA